MKIVTDIDIDLKNRDDLLEHLVYISASIIRDDELRKHNVGVYFQATPIDPLTGLCSIPYKEAEDRGYFKIDLLNLHIYDKVRDEEHLRALLAAEPMWEMLEDRDIVEGLFQLSGEGTFEVLQQYKPKSIYQLAIVGALIRPGKKYLVGKTWEELESAIWKPTDSYYWKKSHAIAYAHNIVIQMNLLVEEVLQNVDKR